MSFPRRTAGEGKKARAALRCNETGTNGPPHPSLRATFPSRGRLRGAGRCGAPGVPLRCERVPTPPLPSRQAAPPSPQGEGCEEWGDAEPSGTPLRCERVPTSPLPSRQPRHLPRRGRLRGAGRRGRRPLPLPRFVTSFLPFCAGCRYQAGGGRCRIRACDPKAVYQPSSPSAPNACIRREVSDPKTLRRIVWGKRCRPKNPFEEASLRATRKRDSTATGSRTGRGKRMINQ